MFQLGSMHRSRRGPRAFSALEVTAAVLILTILGLVSIAGVRFIGVHDRVEQTARRLTHAFSTARAMAIANNATYTVKIDRAHRNFWIDETDVNGTTYSAKVVRPELLESGVVIDTFLFGAVPATGEPLQSVRLFSDGSSDDVTIMFRNDVDNASDPTNIYTVRLYGPTGQCRVFEKQRLTPSSTSTF